MPDPLEIVVVASRIPNAIQFATLPDYSQYYNSLPYDSKDQEWKFGPYADLVKDMTNPNDSKRAMIDAIIANYRDKLEDFINLVQSKINESRIYIGMGKYMTGPELLSKVLGMQTVVTGKSYAAGYAGANYGDKFEIDYKHLGTYVQWGQEGVSYLMLHEVAHNTVSGIETRSWMLNSFEDEVKRGTMQNGSFKGSNPYFVRQEAYTNSIAKKMADSIGIAITPPNSDPSTWPTNGYEGSFE